MQILYELNKKQKIQSSLNDQKCILMTQFINQYMQSNYIFLCKLISIVISLMHYSSLFVFNIFIKFQIYFIYQNLFFQKSFVRTNFQLRKKVSKRNQIFYVIDNIFLNSILLLRYFNKVQFKNLQGGVIKRFQGNKQILYFLKLIKPFRLDYVQSPLQKNFRQVISFFLSPSRDQELLVKVAALKLNESE
ncbi:transmembrane protein, putative (macronuclear) [Tetrahymena thermophila SB210]|uniref:Transmembrane protein, putative n=1 Tax=Tetrahymena thermophila (strain SB210) TaxID=312017 RepID=W7XB81_TETTS|nr:transmembrane protein, putative [Tetrahymena thermophila SB210]EWS70931.1 transmembrane protein, putative [Tetrahymena thermophila SB210]|eukprot:XP_012656546.1 transmembrane protein, putative [Tetrahymena thermophila SB210]